MELPPIHNHDNCDGGKPPILKVLRGAAGAKEKKKLGIEKKNMAKEKVVNIDDGIALKEI